jgi:hypothetical protein
VKMLILGAAIAIDCHLGGKAAAAGGAAAASEGGED